MSNVLGSRAHYNRPQVSIGNRKVRVACDAEIANINTAIVRLNEAKSATTEAAFVAKVSEAFRLTRNITRERL